MRKPFQFSMRRFCELVAGCAIFIGELWWRSVRERSDLEMFLNRAALWLAGAAAGLVVRHAQKSR